MSRHFPSSTSAESTALHPVPATPAAATADTASGSTHHQISHLTRLVDHLWRTEPDVAPSQRSRLLERLAALEHEVVRISLQHEAGDAIDPELLRACHAEADELLWWWRPTGRDGGRRAA